MMPSGIALTVTGRPSGSAMISESPAKTAHNSGRADAVTSLETAGLISAYLIVSTVRTQQISVHSPFFYGFIADGLGSGHRRVGFVYEFTLIKKPSPREVR